MNKENTKKILIILFWIILWQVIATIINKPLILASFTQTVKSLLSLIITFTFWRAIIKSLFLILLGLLVAYGSGIAIGYLSYRFKFIEELLEPLLAVFKSIPVASISIIILIWFGTNWLSILISFIVVFPQIYFATLNGLKSTDKKMIELAKIYHLDKKTQLLYIYRIAAAPYIISASKSAISMAFKSSIAAEVIATTTNTIGQQLYYSKIYLDTPALFSYTIVIILISMLFEKLIISYLNKLGGKYGNNL